MRVDTFSLKISDAGWLHKSEPMEAGTPIEDINVTGKQDPWNSIDFAFLNSTTPNYKWA